MITPDFNSELLVIEFKCWLWDYRCCEYYPNYDFFPNKEFIDYLYYGEEEEDDKDYDEDFEPFISNPSRDAFVDELVKPFFSENNLEENIKNILGVDALPPIEEINFSGLYEN